MTDEPILRQLRGMWQTVDPAPADLADRVLFALEIEDIEFELLRFRAELAPAGARGPETATSLRFDGGDVSLLLRVSGSAGGPRRLDGWIAPAAVMRVELRAAAGPQTTHSDQTGRFVIDIVPAGLVQLVLHPPDDPATGRPRRLFATWPIQFDPDEPTS